MNELRIPVALLNDQTVSSTCKILLAVIEQDVLCTKTVKELSELIGIVPLAVSRALKKLEGDGRVEVIKTKTEKNTLKYNYKVKSL